jgi:hypothetical protein
MTMAKMAAATASSQSRTALALVQLAVDFSL